MKSFLAIIIIIHIWPFGTHAQNWGDAVWCHRNVYDPLTSGASRKECIDATFKYSWTTNGGGRSSCTGTLINRNTDDASLGFYFISARHCFQRWSQDEYDIDPNQEIDFYFNYQIGIKN